MGNRIQRPQRALPTIVSNIAPDMRRMFDRMRELFNGNDPVIMQSDLIASGSHAVGADGQLQVLDPLPNCLSPPAPTNFTVTGAMTVIVLEWDGVVYGAGLCHQHTEIFRSDTDNFSTATLIGVSNGRVYSDAVGPDTSYYYWIRFVSALNETGPLHGTAGVFGQTARDVGYLIDALSVEYGTDSNAPFFQVDEGFTTDEGVPIAAGTYINTAFIHDAQITSAQIGEIAADKLAVATGTIADAIIGKGHIDDAKIGQTISSEDGFTWKIDKKGEIQARSLSLVDNNGNFLFGVKQGILGNLSSANVDGLGKFSGIDRITQNNIGGYFEGLAVGNAYIGEEIMSGNWSWNGGAYTGWKIDKKGKMYMKDAEFSGTLNIRETDPNTGDRVEIDNNGMRVYVNNVARVKIGKLT